MLKAMRDKTTKRNGQLVQDIGTLPLSGQGCPACPKIFSQCGQQILEYSIVMLAVVAAFTVMKVYAQRGLQAHIKNAADQIGRQNESFEQSMDDGYERSVSTTIANSFSNDTTRVNSTGLAWTYNYSAQSGSAGNVDENTSEIVAVGYSGTPI